MRPQIALIICNLVAFTGGTLIFKQEVKDTPIKKVHVISMNHLDVGYYDGKDKDVGYAVQVLNRYQTEYFVRAVNLSRSLIEKGYIERYVYTTHPWLVSLYVNCPNITLLTTPLKCPSAKELADFKEAVHEGHIAWHAFPMNIQTDFLGKSLFEYGITLGQQLDQMFGIKRTHATMSQRDIPGMTKAVLPLLAKYGVKAISVGVNPGTAPPAVPSPFVWKLHDSDPDGLMAFWDKGGYPINPGPDPAHPRGLAKDKCVIVDGLSEALCWAFRTDNTGPPTSIQEWLGYYEILRAEFPGAEIIASTYDAFVEKLETVKHTLPVRSFEVGDTWTQGVATDPVKAIKYRAFVRAWERCMEMGKCDDSDERIQKMLRFLIKLPEHTWGAHDFLDHKTWTNEKLAIARKSIKNFTLAENAWREQRQFLDFALTALADHPLRDMVKEEYLLVKPTKPDMSGYVKASIEEEFTCPGGSIIKFGSEGSLVRLYDPLNKREWASKDAPLGRVTYDTYVEKDFSDMAKLYNYEATVGYYKPNVTQYAHPEKKRWPVEAVELYKKVNSSQCSFWVKIVTKDPQTVTKYGAPQAHFVQYHSESAEKGFDVTLLMVEKTTTRLPESLSFGFTPVVAEIQEMSKSNGPFTWSIGKMGQQIDPCNVVLNGSQYVHAVDYGVSYLDQSGEGLVLESYDVPAVFIGTTSHVDSPFPVPLHPFDCSSIRTMSFNIYNNIWNTNFIYWYPYEKEDANFKARFGIRFARK